MVEVQLTALERAVMIVLMAEARELSSMELQRDFGISLRGSSRTKLNDLRLVASSRRGPLLVHVLTDHGWHYCRAEFDHVTHPLPGIAGGAMAALLRGVGRFMNKTGYTLADVFDLPERPADFAVGPGSPQEIEDRIRRSYSELAFEAGAWVRLSQLRPLLGPVSPAAVDAALVALAREQQAMLVPESNQKALTAEDRAAAVHFGGEDKHLIAIGAA